MITTLAAAMMIALGSLAQPVEKAQQEAAEPDLRGGAAVFDAALPAALETKRLKTGQLLVKPVINGHPAGWYIFDTGAGICVVSKPYTKELELESAGDISATGVGGSKKLSLYKARTLVLGPVSLSDHPIMEADLSFLRPLVGEEIAGVIGYGVFSRCVVEMDLSVPRILIHDPKGFSLARGEWTELLMRERVPCIRAVCEGHDGVYRLDTGADSYVTFHEPTVKKWELLKDRDVSDVKLGGVGGFVKAKRGTVASFEFGGVRTENVQATFAMEAKGNFGEASKDGNIGAELLKPFTLILDYAGERMAFLRRK